MRKCFSLVVCSFARSFARIDSLIVCCYDNNILNELSMLLCKSQRENGELIENVMGHVIGNARQFCLLSLTSFMRSVSSVQIVQYVCMWIWDVIYFIVYVISMLSDVYAYTYYTSTIRMYLFKNGKRSRCIFIECCQWFFFLLMQDVSHDSTCDTIDVSCLY